MTLYRCCCRSCRSRVERNAKDEEEMTVGRGHAVSSVDQHPHSERTGLIRVCSTIADVVHGCLSALHSPSNRHCLSLLFPPTLTLNAHLQVWKSFVDNKGFASVFSSSHSVPYLVAVSLYTLLQGMMSNVFLMYVYCTSMVLK